MGTVAKRIWNGPFYASNTPVPVTIGWVFLKILETLWRVVVLLLCLAAAGGALIWFNDKGDAPLNQNIETTLSMSAPECKMFPNNPMKITFLNKGKSTVGSVSVAFHAYARGQSTDLAAESTNVRTTFDGVIKPGAYIYYCLELPALSQETSNPVRYSAELLSAEPTPKAYDAGQEGAELTSPSPATNPLKTVTPQPILEIKSPEAQPSPLTGYSGKYPWAKVRGLAFAEQPIVKTAVRKIVQDPEMRGWVLGTNAVSGTISMSGQSVGYSACEPHNCGDRNWSVFVDQATREATVCYHDRLTTGDGSLWYVRSSKAEVQVRDCS